MKQPRYTSNIYDLDDLKNSSSMREDYTQCTSIQSTEWTIYHSIEFKSEKIRQKFEKFKRVATITKSSLEFFENRIPKVIKFSLSPREGKRKKKKKNRDCKIRFSFSSSSINKNPQLTILFVYKLYLYVCNRNTYEATRKLNELIAFTISFFFFPHLSFLPLQ